MQQDIRISLFKVVGSPFCVASSDGQKVYERVAAALKAEKEISISFHNVTALTAAFLNSAHWTVHMECLVKKRSGLILRWKTLNRTTWLY